MVRSLEMRVGDRVRETTRRRRRRQCRNAVSRESVKWGREDTGVECEGGEGRQTDRQTAVRGYSVRVGVR